jgi:cell division septation protein DedD
MTSDVRAALDAGDDGFHEIQLNGKQLVFLGMATTLVSVVIFLCGVLVGRGVKPLDTVAQAAGPQVFDTAAASPVAPGAITTPDPPPPAAPAPSGGNGTAAVAAAAAGSAGDTEPTPLGDEPDPSAPAPASDAAAAAPAKPPAVEPPAIEPKSPKVEPRPAAKPKPAPVQASAAPPAPVVPAPKPTPAPAAMATTAPATGGGQIAVQVGAFATRKEADTLAKKLSGRGYAVYVMNPIDDGKNVYRVRVGNYSTADEAQRVSAKLTQQEKLKPWVIR